MPIPAQDFDPTEVAVTWQELKQNQFDITFATPLGEVSQGDMKMVNGNGLGIWKNLLMAEPPAVKAYNNLIQSVEFMNPISWDKIDTAQYAGLILPGGHAPGMKEYLESDRLQKIVAEFFENKKLVAAICHGTVLATRSKRSDGKSVLYGYKSTGLLKSQELIAWGLTAIYLGNYYRTYPETVQDEVTRALEKPEDFQTGPFPIMRDRIDNLKSGFVVCDRNYISARWPGDVHSFSQTIIQFYS